VVLRILDAPAQFLDDVRRRRQVGVPHAQVDHVDALRLGLGLEIVEDSEEVERQPLHTVGFVPLALGRALRLLAAGGVELAFQLLNRLLHGITTSSGSWSAAKA
jgi:hypothetical protein